MPTDLDTLRHYGILGMHWGQRKGGISSRSRHFKPIRIKPKGMSNKEFDAEYAKEIKAARRRKAAGIRIKPKGMSNKEFDAEYAKEINAAKAHAKEKAEKSKTMTKKYSLLTGDPNVSKGAKIAASSLAIAGALGYAYLATH